MRPFLIDLEGSRPTTYDFLQGGYCNDEDVAAATVKWARPKILGAPAPAAKWVEFFMIEEDKSFERTGSSFSIDSSDFDPVTDADKLCTFFDLPDQSPRYEFKITFRLLCCFTMKFNYGKIPPERRFRTAGERKNKEDEQDKPKRGKDSFSVTFSLKGTFRHGPNRFNSTSENSMQSESRQLGLVLDDETALINSVVAQSQASSQGFVLGRHRVAAVQGEAVSSASDVDSSIEQFRSSFHGLKKIDLSFVWFVPVPKAVPLELWYSLSNLSKPLGVDLDETALVTRVIAGSQSDDRGIVVGKHRIVEVNHAPIETAQHVFKEISVLKSEQCVSTAGQAFGSVVIKFAVVGDSEQQYRNEVRYNKNSDRRQRLMAELLKANAAKDKAGVAMLQEQLRSMDWELDVLEEGALEHGGFNKSGPWSKIRDVRGAAEALRVKTKSAERLKTDTSDEESSGSGGGSRWATAAAAARVIDRGAAAATAAASTLSLTDMG